MIASDGEIPLFGQAAPHPRSYGTFRARCWPSMVREKHDLMLEEAIRKMSGYPAQRLKLWDPRPAASGNEGGCGDLRPGHGGGQSHL